MSNLLWSQAFEKPVVSDSAYTIPLFKASYAVQLTGADMADRFGTNNNIGGSFAVKTKKVISYGEPLLDKTIFLTNLKIAMEW